MIIFINGSINSGKSTIAKILADRLGKVALVEVDSLRKFIDWMSIDKSIPINLENAVSVIKNFVKHNIDVVIPYPLSIDNYKNLIKNLKEYKDKIHVFTLSPKLKVALKNRGPRELSNQEKERIRHHYDIGIPNPDFGVIIDNSNETPEETTEKILKIIYPHTN